MIKFDEHVFQVIVVFQLYFLFAMFWDQLPMGGIVVQLALLKLRSPKVQVRGINTPEKPTCLLKNDVWKTTLQEINISHLGKRKIIFKFAGNQGDMLIPWKTIFPFELVPFEGDMFIFGW